MPCPSCCPSFMAPTYLQCSRVSVTISKLDTRKRWLNSGVERALVPIHEQHGSLPPGHPVAPHAVVPGSNKMLSKHKTGCKNSPAVLQVAIRQHASALARALPVFPLPYIMIVAANQLSFAAAVHAQNVTKIQRRKGTECYKNTEEGHRMLQKYRRGGAQNAAKIQRRKGVTHTPPWKCPLYSSPEVQTR